MTCCFGWVRKDRSKELHNFQDMTWHNKIRQDMVRSVDMHPNVTTRPDVQLSGTASDVRMLFHSVDNAQEKKGAVAKLHRISPAAADELSRVVQVTLAMCTLARCYSSDGSCSVAIAFTMTLCHRIILLLSPRKCCQQERLLFIVPHIHPEVMHVRLVWMTCPTCVCRAEDAG